MPRQPARQWLPAYLIVVLLYGTSFAWIKVGLGSFTPSGIAIGRTFIAAVSLLIVLAVTRTRFPPRRLWGILLLNAMLAATIPWGLTALGEQYISSALTAIVGSTGPLFTLLAILVAFPEERPTWQRMLGLGVGFVGVLIVVGVWRGIGTATWIGIAAVIAANVIWSWSLPVSRRYLTGGIRATDISPTALAAGMYTLASIAVVPFLVVVPVVHERVDWSAGLAIGMLGALGSGLAAVMNFRVIGRADATTASTVLYLTPLVAVIVGSTVMGETVTWNEPVGGVVILMGAALAQGLVSFGKSRTRPLQPDEAG